MSLALAPTAAQRAESPTPPSPEPTSFAAGRYEVRRFLGEGGKKKVHLAHDSLLNGDVAFALTKTEGLDEVFRTRIPIGSFLSTRIELCIAASFSWSALMLTFQHRVDGSLHPVPWGLSSTSGQQRTFDFTASSILALQAREINVVLSLSHLTCVNKDS